MIAITKLIMIGIAIVCSATLAFIILDFVEDKVKSKSSKKISHVKFYVARDMNGNLWLYMGKPNRGIDMFDGSCEYCICSAGTYFNRFGLNENDYVNLKWEDEPVEVFLNLED